MGCTFGKVGSDAFTAENHIKVGDFEEPVQPLSTAGGTASFVRLVPVKGGKFEERGPGYFIGKDRSHAKGEVQFYERILRIRSSPIIAQWPIVNHMLEYAGVYRLKSKNETNQATSKDFIVLNNLFHGRKQARLMDVKMGNITSVRNWSGKSCFAAWRNRQIDRITNSEREGYRMEGMHNPPKALESMTPFLAKKRTTRLMYQRLRAEEFMKQFLDLSHLTSDDSLHLSIPEFTICLHLDLIAELCDVVGELEIVPVPQKWIGSSLVIGFDMGTLPVRRDSKRTRTDLNVTLLDWGRSELTSIVAFRKFMPFTKADRFKYWTQYRDSVYRLLYESINLYYDLYVRGNETEAIKVEIFDYDKLSADDFIGYALVPLAPFGNTKFPLLNSDGVPVIGYDGSPSSVNVSITYENVDSDILSGYFKIQLISGSCLPRMDFLNGCSDAYARIRTIQGIELGRSHIVPNVENPVWDIPHYIPVVDREKHLEMLAGCFGNHVTLDPVDVQALKDLITSICSSPDSKNPDGGVRVLRTIYADSGIAHYSYRWTHNNSVA
jgi:hypothetical protein